jgi:hypothetical protein
MVLRSAYLSHTVFSRLLKKPRSYFDQALRPLVDGTTKPVEPFIAE